MTSIVFLSSPPAPWSFGLGPYNFGYGYADEHPDNENNQVQLTPKLYCMLSFHITMQKAGNIDAGIPPLLYPAPSIHHPLQATTQFIHWIPIYTKNTPLTNLCQVASR